METQKEDGSAHLGSFVDDRFRAIGASNLASAAKQALAGPQRRQRPTQEKKASKLTPAADRALTGTQRRLARERKPVIAVISRPGEKTTGEMCIPSSQASDLLLLKLCEAGAIPIIIPEINSLDAIPELFGPNSLFDGVVVPGTDWSDLAPQWYGEENSGNSKNSNPNLDRFDMSVILWCTLVLPMPFLCMCLGFQAWNVVMGGSLYQDLVKQRRPQMPTQDHSQWAFGQEAEHGVVIDGASQLYHLMGHTRNIQTNTLHHQGVDKVAPGLLPVGHAHDWVVEALEFDPGWMKLMGMGMGAQRQFALGTQFHPEIEVTDRESSAALSQIIPSFVQAAKKRR